jgi:proliferating cell nuclear antigen
MEIIISNPVKAELFTSIFQNIKIFTDHISIVCKTTGFFFQAMDNSRVCIIELEIPSTWFDTYSVPVDVVIGINSNILFKILNAREKTQNIRIVYNDDNSDTLFINFTSEDARIFDKRFEMPLIEIEIDQMEIPAIDYITEFTVPSSVFSGLINQFKTFGDTLHIFCSEEKIVLSSNSVECGKMSVEMNIDDLSSFSINEGQELEMSFSLLYLHNICCFNKISKEMEIKISDNYPLSIIYDLQNEAIMKFYLAPKINDSD